METGSKLEKLVIGAREIKGLIGRNLLQGLVVSAFLHSALLAIVGLWPAPEKEDRLAGSGSDTLVIVSRPRPDLPVIERSRPAPPAKPDIDVWEPVENEADAPDTLLEPEEDLPSLSGPYDPDAPIDSSAVPGSGGSGGIDTATLAGFDPVTPTYIPRDIEPMALADLNPQPEYPRLAQQAGVSGTVRVWVRVNKQGNVDNWQVIDVNPAGLGFEDAVARVIPKWKFTPAVAGNRPVTVWVAIPFKFSVK